MGRKLQQVSDNIHGTIYLSNLESEMISTPYFYRLHDIYQSSTVYMTFPSNRTKRYEHSLGTMELAGNMLYSSVSNSDIETQNKLFEYLGKYFDQVLSSVISKFGRNIPSYLSKNTDAINRLFGQAYKNCPRNSIEKTTIAHIKEALSKGCFTDPALDYFQYSQMQVNERDNDTDIKSYFLYRCLLQSIRIVALFHDVGHPPYSHVIESVLDGLYKEYSIKKEKDSANTRINEFVECINNYYDIFIQTLICKSSPSDSKLHEKIGLSFLESAINDTIPYILEEILSSQRSKSCKISSVLYYTLVVEFALSILVENDMFFKSMHKIVDGLLDADRLDYITRDSLNSGVDWGRVPYKRLINSAKLIFVDEFHGVKLQDSEKAFVIAYPQKLTDDIEDILLIRYKIFARINFHHRCVKTANALSTSVKILSDDYLNSTEECINSEISNLWKTLELTVGDRRNRVILWNDSWLISTLNQALVKIDEEEYEENEKFFNSTVKRLKENLEEILLNKKKFYSVLKRGIDNIKFVKKIFSCMGINEKDIDFLRQKEIIKGYENINEKVTIENMLSSSMANALDSLNRISEIMREGDIEQLNSYFPAKNRSLKAIIEQTLQDFKSEGILDDFIVYINKDKEKTGIPSHQDLLDEIYLYNNSSYLVFNEKISLKPRIKSIAKNIPWLFIYIVPGKQCTDINKLNENILNQLANKIADEIKTRLVELFPSILIDK